MNGSALEDDEIDEETGEFGEFLSDPMRNLSCVFRQCPDIRDRTENEVYYKVDKQIKEMPSVINISDVKRMGCATC